MIAYFRYFPTNMAGRTDLLMISTVIALQAHTYLKHVCTYVMVMSYI